MRLVLVPVLIALVVLLVIPAAVAYPFAMLLNYPIEQAVSPASTLGMIAAVVLGVFLMKSVSRIKVADLGLDSRKAVSGSLQGILWGFGLLALVACTINLLGGVTTGWGANPQASVILVGFIFFLFQGTWEELIYRAYLMPHFTKVMGAPLSIIVTSAMFTLFHGMNPGMTAMPIINLMLASLVFSLAYYITGNLWLVGIGHGIWNFSQGYIFGSQVSGNIVDGSLLQSPAVAGKDLISGGGFGFEGGLVTSIFSIILIAVFIVIARKQRA